MAEPDARRPRAGRGHLPRHQPAAWPTCRAPSRSRPTSRSTRGARYEFRVYQQLGELYIKQERTKDAADTFGAFARRQPAARAGAAAAGARDRDLRAGRLRQPGARGEEGLRLALRRRQRIPPRQPGTAGRRRSRWSRRTWPSWRATITPARRRARRAPTTRRRCAGTAPTSPRSRPTRDAAQNNFLLAELLFEDKRFAEAAVEYEKTAYGYPHARQERRRRLCRAAGLRRSRRRRAAPAELPALQRAGVESALRFAKAFPAATRAPAPVLTNAAEKLYALQRRRAGRQRGAAGAGAAAAGRARRSAASPGPCSRTPRSSAARSTGPSAAYARGARADAREGRRRATTWSSAWPRRSTSRASRRARPASARTRSATSRASRRSRRSRPCAPPRSTTPRPR